MSAFYNERDPYAAQWLRNLIDAGHIAPGVVDERDIRDIRPDELSGFTQCHFFAGIGVWAHALRRAGWPDDRPIWTGSCPCQPFSAAGAGKGFADERHLWPHWFHLVAQHGPAIVLGEQVASKDGLGWLDLVSTDLEGAGYAFAAADLCAAGVGGAHIRQRLYFVGLGDGEQPRLEGHAGHGDGATGRAFPAGSVAASGCAGGLADTCFDRDREHVRELSGHEGQHEVRTADGDNASVTGGSVGRVADAESIGSGTGLRDPRPTVDGLGLAQPSDSGAVREGRTHAPMLGRNAADWLFCRDGKWRPVEPGTFPLAHAAPARVGRLRAYGNALDAETATAFVEAVMSEMATCVSQHA